MSRPALSLIFLSPDKIARVDMDSQGELLNYWEQTRSPQLSAALAVDSAMRLGTAPARKAWVLNSEIWIQILSLPLAATRRSNPNEVVMALKYEAEALSGVEVADSICAYKALESTSSEQYYWIALMNQGQFNEIHECLNQLSCQFLGMAHPAGLPSPLSLNLEDNAEPWNRIELWPEAIFAFQAPQQRFIVSANPQSALWQSEVQGWLNQWDIPEAREVLFSHADFEAHGEPEINGATEDLWGSREELAELTSPDLFESRSRRVLSDPDTLQSFLHSWARHLSEDPSATPLLAPEAPTLGGRRLFALSLSLVCVTLLLCFLHYRHLTQAIQSEELKRGKQNGQQKQAQAQREQTRLAQSRKPLEERRDLLKKQVAAAKKIYAVHNERLTRLLVSLTRRLKGDIELQSIDSQGGHVVLSGRALGPEPISALSTALASDLKSHCWRAQPPESHYIADQSYEAGGYWAFEVKLEDVSLGELKSLSAQSAARARVQ